MSYDTALTLGSIAALIGTILLFIFVLPKHLDGRQKNGFLQFLHDFFRFKQLFIESIMRFFYVLSTLACIATGFFMLFAKVEYYRYSESLAGYGLLIMLLGPVMIRIIYEVMMMGILLVQNVIDINKKLGPAPQQPAPQQYAPPVQDPYAPAPFGQSAPYNGYQNAAPTNNRNAYQNTAPTNNHNGYQGGNQY